MGRGSPVHPPAGAGAVVNVGAHVAVWNTSSFPFWPLRGPEAWPPVFHGSGQCLLTLSPQEAGCPHVGLAPGWRQVLGAFWAPHPRAVTSPSWTVPTVAGRAEGAWLCATVVPPDWQDHFLLQTRDFCQNQFPRKPAGRGWWRRGPGVPGSGSPGAPHGWLAERPRRQGCGSYPSGGLPSRSAGE